MVKLNQSILHMLHIGTRAGWRRIEISHFWFLYLLVKDKLYKENEYFKIMLLHTSHAILCGVITHQYKFFSLQLNSNIVFVAEREGREEFRGSGVGVGVKNYHIY